MKVKIEFDTDQMGAMATISHDGRETDNIEELTVRLNGKKMPEYSYTEIDRSGIPRKRSFIRYEEGNAPSEAVFKTSR